MSSAILLLSQMHFRAVKWCLKLSQMVDAEGHAIHYIKKTQKNNKQMNLQHCALFATLGGIIII